METVSSQSVMLFESFRRCGLARGSTSVGADLELSKPPAIPSTLSLRSQLALLAATPAAASALPPYGGLLSLWNQNSK